jgi:hypothetical protein
VKPRSVEDARNRDLKTEDMTVGESNLLQDAVTKCLRSAKDHARLTTGYRAWMPERKCILRIQPASDRQRIIAGNRCKRLAEFVCDGDIPICE